MSHRPEPRRRACRSDPWHVRWECQHGLLSAREALPEPGREPRGKWQFASVSRGDLSI